MTYTVIFLLITIFKCHDLFFQKRKQMNVVPRQYICEHPQIVVNEKDNSCVKSSK